MPLRFGDCILDPDLRQLTRPSGRGFHWPRVFDPCCFSSLENRTRVVSKDDLLEAVWRGRIVCGIDAHQPHQRARAPRSATTARTRRLIKTIARKGFRFVGDVAETASDAAGASQRSIALVAAEPAGQALDRRASVRES